MSDIFKEIVLRVFVSGIMCTIALILSGNGPHKEPVRLCCVALTLIVLIKPYSHNLPDIATVLGSKEAIRESVESEVANANMERCNAAIKKVEEYVNSLIDAEGLQGVAELEYKLEDNTLYITKATVTGTLELSEKAQVSNILKSQCGLSAEYIVFKEEVP